MVGRKDTLLIANRGEVALRIAQAAHEMGLRVALVVSREDAHSPAALQADQVVQLPGNTLAETYLDQEKMLAAVGETQATLLHPGFGFLSENAKFAQRVLDAGCAWVGPPPASMQMLSSKVAAKEKARTLGIPIVPWCVVPRVSSESQETIRRDIGFPALVKACAGGGGKGLKRIDHEKDTAAILESASREAQEAFGDGSLFVEKFIARPRHIEIQAFGLDDGQILTFGERDCSIQRRYQKIVEESPSPGLERSLIEKLEQDAKRLLSACGYRSAGTVEFLYDLEQRQYYFMEVNTRLQVEHPVTEERYGIDLVQMQLHLALGHPVALPEAQPRGHVMELRLYAEDASMHFLPQPGKVYSLAFPRTKGFRLECGIQGGDTITGSYDPMVAKMIFSDRDRAQVLAKAKNVLQQTRILGPTTNRDFLLALLDHPRFVAGDVDTKFLQDEAKAFSDGLKDPAVLADLALGLVKTLEGVEASNLGSTKGEGGSSEPLNPFSALKFRDGL